MSSLVRRYKLVALAAVLNLCMPWRAEAADAPPTVAAIADANAAPETVNVLDIALADGGLLVGQVYDASGGPAAGTEVALISNGAVIAHTVTDRTGVFRVAGVVGGTYQLATPSKLQLVRAWAPRTAPPAAHQVAMMVQDETVVRGQCDCGSTVGCSDCVGENRNGRAYAGQAYGGRPVLEWMRAHPGMVIAGVAAAIAVPVAIAASDDDDHS
jgi:hypothetical protein